VDDSWKAGIYNFMDVPLVSTTSERSLVKGGQMPAKNLTGGTRETAAITRHLREKRNEGVPLWGLYTKASLFLNHLFLGTFLGHDIDLCPELVQVTEKLV
jgi:hypothetical protein